MVSEASVDRFEALFREGRKTLEEVDKLVTLATDPGAYAQERATAAAEACARLRRSGVLPNLVKLADWLEARRDMIVRAVKMASTVDQARAGGVGRLVDTLFRR